MASHEKIKRNRWNVRPVGEEYTNLTTAGIPEERRRKQVFIALEFDTHCTDPLYRIKLGPDVRVKFIYSQGSDRDDRSDVALTCKKRAGSS